ncbi:hypothetical protein PHYSODRAFT_301322 [Phytophthora sojae]|uniref:HAT C-terminal dimerisation domain-containing protein n=1 Tax=Phytophthora sojae (strain P6497) TaxID=1094619 RepID=G4ZJG1_PHYSP|nr:hypothetical protein PHYSODRAFT_301322 [Phytophthora sojae]EGZ18826.1 hypothetical protein PHYSODRAFT_301322 [Phytophthora sojae]|eukprot:XP_009527884.1 hypothetical protein PHYSODRAFT_301322 [Phytophthora sojae]
MCRYGGRTPVPRSLGALQDRQRNAAFEVQECPLSVLRSTPYQDPAVTAPQEAHHDLRQEALSDASSDGILHELLRISVEAQEVATFVRNHTATNSRFAEAIRSPDNIDNRRSLKIPVATRWYSRYECVKLVVESERSIRELASDDALLAKYNALKVTSFKRIARSEAFWIKGDMALKLLTPIHKVLAHFEKDSLCLSVVFQQFVELQQGSVYNDDVPGISKDMQAMFRERIQARWEFIDSSPMRIAYLPDHRRDTRLFTTQQQNFTVADLESLAARFPYTPTQIQAHRKELGKFMEAKRKWGGETKRSYHADSPITWWTWIGDKDYPILSTIAQRIFTIPASSAAAERSWSVFKYVHSSQRNRLTNERLIMLVFIYSNHGMKKARSDVVAVTVAELDPGPSESRPPERCDAEPEDATARERSVAVEYQASASTVIQGRALEEYEHHRDWADDDDQYASVEWWGNIDRSFGYEAWV